MYDTYVMRIISRKNLFVTEKNADRFIYMLLPTRIKLILYILRCSMLVVGGPPQDYENYLFWLLHTPPIVYGAYTRLILTLKTSFCKIIALTNLWSPLGRFCERAATLVKY